MEDHLNHITITDDQNLGGGAGMGARGVNARGGGANSPQLLPTPPPRRGEFAGDGLPAAFVPKISRVASR